MRIFILISAMYAFLLACDGNRQPPAEQGGRSSRVLSKTTWTAASLSESSDTAADRFMLVTGVETGRHESYDRIVFEFSAASLPGYHLEYIDSPVRECGSGRPVALPGDGWLEISFSPARMHDRHGSTIGARQRQLGYPVLLELAAVCDFENRVTWVSAVSEPNRFRALVLENPARLAVDILHAGIDPGSVE